MKLIKCVIRPEKEDEVIVALQNAAPGMTVSKVCGYGRQKGQSLVYRGIEYKVSLLPKVMIEIVAEDNRVDDIVKLVIDTARTGNIGDGRIFIDEVEQAYHIRTGFMERG